MKEIIASEQRGIGLSSNSAVAGRCAVLWRKSVLPAIASEYKSGLLFNKKKANLEEEQSNLAKSQPI